MGKLIKFFVLFLIAGFVGSGFLTTLSAQSDPPADYACDIEVNFDANPKEVAADKPITISGYIISKKRVPYTSSGGNPIGNAGLCYVRRQIPKNQTLVIAIVDNRGTEERELFAFNLVLNRYSTSGTPPPDRIDFPSRQFTAQQYSVLTSGTLNLIAKVKALIGPAPSSGAGDTWVQLTQSDPVQVQYTQPPQPNASSMFGCKAANGVFTCATDPAAASISACPKPVSKVEPADKCGCTEADYTAGKCKNGQAVGPGGNGPAPNPANLPTDRLFNPLPLDNITGTFIVIVKGFLMILGIWAVIFIIVGGFRLVISAGNEEAVTAAKKTITWAILGLVIAALSFSIVAIVQNLLRAKLTP